MDARLLGAVVIAALVAAYGAGCDATGEQEQAPPAASSGDRAAEPAPAPETGSAPGGRMVSVGNAPEGIVVGTSGVAAAGVRDPDGVVFFDAATGAIRHTIPTEGAPRHLSLAGPDGPVIIPLEGSDELVEVSLGDAAILSRTAGVGRQPHDAVRTGDGTVVVTNEMGGGVVFVRDGAVASSLPAGPPQPEGAAAVGRYAAVADVRGNGVWVYDGAAGTLVAQAPVGQKLTPAVSLDGGVAAFADTDGGAVLLERISPQVREVARIDAPGNPYGLAFDARHHLLFVTLTATNTLRVIDVTDPAGPRILGDLPTVQQPNSVAVDPRDGTVLITGSTPGPASAVQIITPNLLPTR